MKPKDFYSTSQRGIEASEEIVEEVIANSSVQITKNKGIEMDYLRFQSQYRLKLSFEKIFEKYGKEIDCDEIDLVTGEVVVDRGCLAALDIKPIGHNIKDINADELRYCRELFDSIVGELDGELDDGEPSDFSDPNQELGDCSDINKADYIQRNFNDLDDNSNYIQYQDSKYQDSDYQDAGNHAQVSREQSDISKRCLYRDDLYPYKVMVKRIRYFQEPTLRITKRYIRKTPPYRDPQYNFCYELNYEPQYYIPQMNHYSSQYRLTYPDNCTQYDSRYHPYYIDNQEDIENYSLEEMEAEDIHSEEENGPDDFEEELIHDYSSADSQTDDLTEGFDRSPGELNANDQNSNISHVDTEQSSFEDDAGSDEIDELTQI